MKNTITLLFTLLLFFYGSKFFAQAQPYQEYNRWGLKSFGFSATYGGEKFFKPITFAHFKQNSGSDGKYFELPPGASDHGSRDLDDVPPLGLGLQLTWPVGKRHNELRAGFAFQDHLNGTSANSRYNLSPDTIRFHSVSISDAYVISQANFDYVMYTKPLLNKVRLLWRISSTFGVSTRHDYTHQETIFDNDIADVHISPNGNYSYNPKKGITYSRRTSLDSSPRLEAGIRSSLGVEIFVNVFHQKIGLSAEYGHGLAGEKILKGGTTNYKRTEFGQLQARYFLR